MQPTAEASAQSLTALTPAFDGAEGFGAYSEGGRGGTVYTVTNLSDSGTGSFRWAVERTGRRIVQFAVDGVIQLKSPINITEPNITIDGRGALGPGASGITLRDHTLNIRTKHVVVRYLRIRLGDYAVAKSVITARRTRPSGSDDLDCVNIDRAENVILDHLSLGWSADEIVSVTNSRNGHRPVVHSRRAPRRQARRHLHPPLRRQPPIRCQQQRRHPDLSPQPVRALPLPWAPV